MAENIGVIFAGVTLLILWSATVIGGAIWLMSQLQKLKDDILQNFEAKHRANAERYDGLAVIVTRHDTILNPEWRSQYEFRRPK